MLDTCAALHASTSIVSKFRERVATAATRLAVKGPDVAYTYGDLDRASSRIANFLLERLGDGSEPVALLAPHGARMFAMHLGVLKAGKFYVPLDASYPDPRNRTILEDVEAQLLLTCAATADAGGRVAEGLAETIDVDRLPDDVPEADPGLDLPPDTYAYVLYTSGTTGKPKGVIENHRDVLHMADVATRSVGLNQDDRLLMVAPLIFSASAWQVLATLLIGMTVFPFDVRANGAGAALVDTIEDNRVTIWSTVPSIFRSTASYLLATGRRLETLRILKLGGDRVLAADFELYRKCCADDCVFLTGYGMSEVKHITRFSADKATRIDTPRMPIGFPELGNEVLLLDEKGAPVPPGAVGEFVVRTVFASPGYWKRPALNAERFERDGEQTLFWTGDLGRQDADGCFHHVGRKDSQVKIRGSLVELGEVEAALLRLDGVREALAVLRDGHDGSETLVAYYIPKEGQRPSASSLRASLKAALPDYMVPAAYVPMEAFPVNSNGKLDRRQLPPPSRREHRI